MPEPMVHVIDDDDDARDSLAFLLRTEDLAVETYATAQAFLTVARSVGGVVITDVRMPEIDGLEPIWPSAATLGSRCRSLSLPATQTCPWPWRR